MSPSPGLTINVQAAEVFAPLWEKPARFKGAHGGRGSGKSHDRAQAVILAMLEGKRIVCLREVQNTIRDSVRQLLVDTIQRMRIGHLFEVLDAEIRGPLGSICIFRGMRDANAESIKSLEGFDIAWFEEAQTMSSRSMDLLIPTIRKDGSEIWFTWNPAKPSDAVDRLLRQTDPGNAIVVQANWKDNPWFPEVLHEERERCARDEPEKYPHIWEGDYLAASDMQFIPRPLVVAARKADAAHMPDDEKVMGVDLAWGGADETVIAYRCGQDARTHKWETMRLSDTMQLVGKVAEAYHRFQPDALFIDNGGAGKGVCDRLMQLGLPLIAVDSAAKPDGEIGGVKVANKRAEMWARMKAWLNGAAIPDDELLDAHLTGLEYDFNPRNEIVLESKQKLRREGRPSPDRADALALTFAFPVVTRKMRQAMPDLARQGPGPKRNANPYLNK